MKHTMQSILFFALLLFALLALPASLVHASLQPNIIVSRFQVTNGEAAVGHSFTLEVTLANTEPSVCAQAITTSVQAGPPFIMDGVSTVPAGDLCYGATKTVDFPMRIDPTATGGFYQLTITSGYETSLLAQYSNANTINVFVQGTPELSASIADSNPIDVYPGDTATVTVDLQNNGGFEAQSVTANLTAPSPLEAKWSNSFASLGTIGARQGKTADFTIEVPKDAAAQDYPMSLGVDYLDENLTQQTVTFPLVFHVKAKALFATVDAGSDSLYANDNSRVVRLLLQNTGTDAARKVTVKIEPQFPFSTDGSVRYIDIIEPGKSAPVDFVVNVDKDGTVGTYGLNAIIDFEDAQGKQLHDTAQVSLTVGQKSMLQEVFYDYWVGWLIVIAVAIIIVIRNGRAKKK